MYHPLSPQHVLDSIQHIRNLYRKAHFRSPKELAAQSAREVFIHDILVNLRHGSIHPTPRLLYEASRHLHLTMDGAYRMFGYDLDRIQYYDFLINSRHTRVIESYSFHRDIAVDVPAELGETRVFSQNAMLKDVVGRWHRSVPIRALEGGTWRHPATFYVQVGTDDSYGMGLPAGTIASVQQISVEESLAPNPEATYLLQFGNGYACVGCVVSHGRLSLLLQKRGILRKT